MAPETEHKVQVAQGDESQALVWLAVLAAQQIEYVIAIEDEAWHILVPSALLEHAQAEIKAYEDDERRRELLKISKKEPDAPVLKSWSPLWVSCLVLGFYLWLGPYNWSNLFLRQAAADPRAILHGKEYWRVITALMVHGDSVHLSGNLFALLFFGWGVCRLYGGGLAWLLILFAGSLGNFLTAWSKNIPSIGFGASTACFGALGIMTARQTLQILRQEGLARTPWSRVWIPLGAGLSLLAFLGSSPGSDLIAHLAGFMAGGLLGWLLDPRKITKIKSAAWQRVLQVVVLAIVISAWRSVMQKPIF